MSLDPSAPKLRFRDVTKGSHGWRWVDRSGWTEEEEVKYVKKAIEGESASYLGPWLRLLMVSDTKGDWQTASRVVLRYGAVQSWSPFSSACHQDV